MSEQKIAVVTGTSSGIGLETAIHLAKNGFKTYATMRNLNKAQAIKQRGQLENLPIEILELDVNDDASVKNAINTIVEKEGRIDVLVNNAGYALLGAVEDLSTEEINDQFNTNVLGPYRTVREVLPTMRKQKSGRIITISSIAGFMGMGAGSAYAASKFAVEGFTESLRHEISQFGIHACVVEPGAIKTPIMESSPMAKKAQENPTYSELYEGLGKTMTNMLENHASPPSVVAEEVLKAATSENPGTRYTAGEDAKMMEKARKTMSDKEFENLVSTSFFPQK
jgi:NAD(P)-dependent dehydrogenase (short-subunit alcohol dehydrogenase family)